MPYKQFTILSIEDNKADFQLLKQNLLSISEVDLTIMNIDNGDKAMDFIFKMNGYQSAKTPDLIILDINLPSIDGTEILKKIKEHKIYRIIPIIVFSTSDAEEDIIKSYNLYANSYITKSFEIGDIFKKIAVMGEYWLKTAILPKIENICFVHKENHKE